MGSRYSPLVSFMLVFVLFLFICYNWTNKFVYIKKPEIKGLFIWSGGPRSSGVCFFCFHALGDTKQEKPTPLDLGPPLHVNRVLHVKIKTDRAFKRIIINFSAQTHQ